MKVQIHPPDGARPVELSLEPGASLLVGRTPDPSSVAEGACPPATRTLVLPSGLVSSNHLAVWAVDDGLRALDLGSKNGSYMRLESGATASLPRAPEAHFFLAGPRPVAVTGGLPDLPLGDRTAGAFAERLRDVVSRWLTASGHADGLSVAIAGPGRGEPADGALSIPLAEGLALEVIEPDAEQTELRWDTLKAELYPYVHEQAARWRACHASGGLPVLAFGSAGASRTLREVLEAARLHVPLVLRGESGTGKTALAAIYARREAGIDRSGARGDPPFVTVHCAHLDPPLAHATLFGALKGSYTSSERTVPGAVKLADGGVLFLDDVDALPLETQAKLLRFLDEGRYEPLGHGQRDSLVAHVRVVASTNVDLRAAVRERRFREDLYWRLHMGAVVRVPPLRERPEDIEQLLRDSPLEGGRSVRDRLEPEALEYLLRQHPWRGNFRECLRFCTRIRMEPTRGPLLDRRRCEAILAEASLEPESPPAPLVLEEGGTTFDRALRQSVRWWLESEGAPPERFDELGRFCETFLKSTFVAHALALSDTDERPESFDRDGRLRLGCDLTTLKRKVDEYVQLRRGRTVPASGA